MACCRAPSPIAGEMPRASAVRDRPQRPRGPIPRTRSVCHETVNASAHNARRGGQGRALPLPHSPAFHETMKPSLLAGAVTAALSLSFFSVPAFAAPESDPASASNLDTVIVTGTRGSARTQFDTMVPIDVFTAADARARESRAVNHLLAQLVLQLVLQRRPV